ncbi:hypothetical protein W59_04071 [Rhodococcus opacus RKJ300 = JCM 13270]|jgi:hypothetical protein|uniref:Uncharacterized protein n=1 Tax=Rhodococcus opacus RKJ300 = JCM 13270 TaxID=1165867 RepID=I0WXW3_RHOOP|nr:hypothetical protein W59_04071 [Rhodococcus opacus RKJ300 = JCM 13270]
MKYPCAAPLVENVARAHSACSVGGRYFLPEGRRVEGVDDDRDNDVGRRGEPGFGGDAEQGDGGLDPHFDVRFGPGRRRKGLRSR